MKNKTALVTGVSGGIGRAIAERYIKEGYLTLCQYNRGEREIESFKSFLQEEKLDALALFYKADFRKDCEVRALYEYAVKNLKNIDVFISNSGVDLYQQINDLAEEDYERVFGVNVKSAVTLSSLISRNMISEKRGNIVYISSVWGLSGASMESVYSASKSALIGLTKSLAKELAPSGIRVNCVAPGVIDTRMNACFTQSEREEIVSEIPLGRMGRAEEIADVVEFLTSEKAGYITGQTIVVDGGYIL